MKEERDRRKKRKQKEEGSRRRLKETDTCERRAKERMGGKSRITVQLKESLSETSGESQAKIAYWRSPPSVKVGGHKH